MARFKDFSDGNLQFRKYDDGYPIWASSDEVRIAKADERRAVAEAKSAVDLALKMLRGRGVGYEKSIAVLRTMSCDELQKLARKVRQPKVVHASNSEESVIDDDKDDKPNPDEQLDKLAAAIQRAHPEAKFSKAQAAAWAVDNLPEARHLTMLSKQRSLDRYGEKTADYFKMAGPAGPPSSTPRTMSPLQSASARSARKPKVVRDPKDSSDFDAGQAAVAAGRRTPDQGTFADRVKQLQNSGLNFDQASTQALRERGNPDAISP